MGLNIISGRYDHLKAVGEGFKRTGVSLVEYDGTQFLPCITADDIGMYCIIPRMMKYFNMSLDTALQVFIHGTMALALIAAFIAFFKLYTSWLSRLVALVGLLFLSRISCDSVDVYKMYIIINTAIIPWALYFAQPHTRFKNFTFFTFIAGVLIGIAHYFRSLSGLPSLAFLSIIIVTHITLHKKQKFVLLSTLLAGLLIPYAYFHYQYYQYKQYAAVHLTGHQAIVDMHHNTWHPIYCGLGFVTNKYNITFEDAAGINKVKSINPDINFYTNEYEEILKNEVMTIVKTDPWFVLLTIWAKIGVALMYLVFFANLGLIAAFFFPKGWRIELAFIVAFIASTLKNIIVVPGVLYSLGTLTCASLYGIASICYALNTHTMRIWYQTLNNKVKNIWR